MTFTSMIQNVWLRVIVTHDMIRELPRFVACHSMLDCLVAKALRALEVEYKLSCLKSLIESRMRHASDAERWLQLAIGKQNLSTDCSYLVAGRLKIEGGWRSGGGCVYLL